jgi:hypothetical protein
VAERLKAVVLKTTESSKDAPGVQISPFPPLIFECENLGVGLEAAIHKSQSNRRTSYKPATGRPTKID